MVHERSEHLQFDNWAENIDFLLLLEYYCHFPQIYVKRENMLFLKLSGHITPLRVMRENNISIVGSG